MYINSKRLILLINSVVLEENVMEKKFFVAVKALLCFDGKILLIKRTKEARGDYYRWEFPGGRLEFGEKPVQALERELLEEIGVTFTSAKLLHAWNFYKNEYTEVVGLTYMCKISSDKIVLSKEHDNYAWVLREELNNYRLVDGLMQQINEYDWDYINNFMNMDDEANG